jgi:hypothetical protein
MEHTFSGQAKGKCKEEVKKMKNFDQAVAAMGTAL